MLVGGLTVLLWIYLDHSYQDLYAMIPGFGLSLLTIIVVSKLTKKPSEEILKEFEEVQKELEETY